MAPRVSHPETERHMESHRRHSGEPMRARLLFAARIVLAGLTVMLGLALPPAYADPGSSPGLSDGSTETGNTSATSVGKFGYVESNGGLGSGSVVGVGRTTTSGSTANGGSGGGTGTGPVE